MLSICQVPSHALSSKVIHAMETQFRSKMLKIIIKIWCLGLVLRDSLFAGVLSQGIKLVKFIGRVFYAYNQ